MSGKDENGSGDDGIVRWDKFDGDVLEQLMALEQND